MIGGDPTDWSGRFDNQGNELAEVQDGPVDRVAGDPLPSGSPERPVGNTDVIRTNWDTNPPGKVETADNITAEEGKQVVAEIVAKYLVPSLKDLDPAEQAAFENQEGVTLAHELLSSLQGNLTGSDFSRLAQFISNHSEIGNSLARGIAHGLRGTELINCPCDDATVSDEEIQAFHDFVNDLPEYAQQVLRPADS